MKERENPTARDAARARDVEVEDSLASERDSELGAVRARWRRRFPPPPRHTSTIFRTLGLLRPDKFAMKNRHGNIIIIYVVSSKSRRFPKTVEISGFFLKNFIYRNRRSA